MIYRSTKEQINEYYTINALNQSAIKVLIYEGVQAFVDKIQLLIVTSELYYEEKEHFVIGNAVDCRITQGEKEFNNQFYVSTLAKKPGEKAMSIIKSVFDKVIANVKPEDNINDNISWHLDAFRSDIINACEQHVYYPKWGAEALINSICKEDGGFITKKDALPEFKGGGYFEDLKLAMGKQILNDSESTTVNNIINNFLNHPHTTNLFKDNDNIDIVYQFPIFFDVHGVQCKGLIDMIIVDHNNKRIIPIDIKTMGSYISNFRQNIRARRYDIQGSFYSYGLNKNLSRLFNTIGRQSIENSINDYKMSNFAFIVESTFKQEVPLVFVLNNELLKQGRDGNPVADGGLKFGWQHGINEYKRWSEDYNFSLERRLESTNGVVFVDDNYEYVNF